VICISKLGWLFISCSWEVGLSNDTPVPWVFIPHNPKAFFLFISRVLIMNILDTLTSDNIHCVLFGRVNHGDYQPFSLFFGIMRFITYCYHSISLIISVFHFDRLSANYLFCINYLRSSLNLFECFSVDIENNCL